MRCLWEMEEEGMQEQLQDPETTEEERARIKEQLE
jgi:hypothetical protein